MNVNIITERLEIVALTPKQLDMWFQKHTEYVKGSGDWLWIRQNS